MLLNLAIFILATYLAAYIGEYALGLAGGLPATCVIVSEPLSILSFPLIPHGERNKGFLISSHSPASRSLLRSSPGGCVTSEATTGEDACLPSYSSIVSALASRSAHFRFSAPLVSRGTVKA